jgi:hypothetical protein
VHDKKGLFFFQLWHQGRNAHSSASGIHPVSSSANPITDAPHSWRGLQTQPFEVPHALTIEEIAQTQDDFVKAALKARKAGADGVEIHAVRFLLSRLHSFCFSLLPSSRPTVTSSTVRFDDDIDFDRVLTCFSSLSTCAEFHHKFVLSPFGSSAAL